MEKIVHFSLWRGNTYYFDSHIKSISLHFYLFLQVQLFFFSVRNTAVLSPSVQCKPRIVSIFDQCFTVESGISLSLFYCVATLSHSVCQCGCGYALEHKFINTSLCEMKDSFASSYPLPLPFRVQKQDTNLSSIFLKSAREEIT